MLQLLKFNPLNSSSWSCKYETMNHARLLANIYVLYVTDYTTARSSKSNYSQLLVIIIFIMQSLINWSAYWSYQVRVRYFFCQTNESYIVVLWIGFCIIILMDNNASNLYIFYWIPTFSLLLWWNNRLVVGDRMQKTEVDSVPTFNTCYNCNYKLFKVIFTSGWWLSFPHWDCLKNSRCLFDIEGDKRLYSNS